MTEKPFLHRLRAAQERRRSWLCVGLDPVLEQLPEVAQRADDPLAYFGQAIVEATADLTCAYKPNLAFWLAYGTAGLRALQSVLEAVPEDVPVILDGKFGDIGHTAAAYARFAFDVLRADAVTVNPYLGLDGVRPFLERADRGTFLLARTSNPSAPDLQDRTAGGEPLYLAVARLAQEWDRALPGTCGLVVGATYPEELARLRAAVPDLPFLIPGLGAQGGDLEAAARYGPAGAVGPVVNVSRAVLYASSGPDFADAARAAALRWVESLQEAATGAPPSVPQEEALARLALALFDAGCVQFGTFTLKSGLTSPIYIDLRLLASYPALLGDVARAMASIARHLSFDRIAAVPYAGIPIGTALALEMGCPLIYPRREVKEHGTRRAIEGAFTPGETVLLVDDLITRGDSKLEAAAPLQEAGLVVRDVLVLIDREQGGAEDLAQHGLRLHAVLPLTRMLAILRDAGRISLAQYSEVLTYLRGNSA
ncbi:MAG: orotidine-5'-phosphate decarboxylase [Anaerolineae bacterium]|nr:orotidine-5'-phosphate decarboxylase [Anaerolineae bacterium]MDW8068531.1 orotidine-5'-phosphate decarboxylase [Anaerolineae bacterium]